MTYFQPIPRNTVQENVATDQIKGTVRNDHLIHHRDIGVDTHAGTGMFGYAGDDILEASVPKVGQIHMFGGAGNDWMILDVTKIPGAVGTQGHHAYGGAGRDTFQFTNIEENFAPVIGRLDDFDPTSDYLLIEDQQIHLSDLPKSIKLSNGKDMEVRVVEIDHPEFEGEDLGSQHFLALGDNIFYALEGARDLSNGASGGHGEERHFLKSSALDALRDAESVQYENPKNFVPRDFYEHREDELNLDWKQFGEAVTAETGGKDAALVFGGKTNHHAHSSGGAQEVNGSSGDDVIDGNTGNDVIKGGEGHDLIAGGLDNDSLSGDAGNDMLWGGDGDDTLQGGWGNDYLHGGRGDDMLVGGMGHDTLFGGQGDNTLTGGGGDSAINRFHFYEDSGENVITDFKVGSDLLTLQDDIDPLTVELYENEAGNTVLNFAEAGSVELLGVTLEAFQEGAGSREDTDNPIITITPDPEEEMLHEFRSEHGHHGDHAMPELKVSGVLYEATAFNDAGPGGYSYVSADSHDHSGHSPDDAGCCTDEPLITDGQTGHEHHDHIHEEEEKEEEEREAQNEAALADATSCFVATAAYRDPWHPDVVFLRAFRDQWLVHRSWGRAFVDFYWRVGPKMAGPVRRNPTLARVSKTLLAVFVRQLRNVPGLGVVPTAVSPSGRGIPAHRRPVVPTVVQPRLMPHRQCAQNPAPEAEATRLPRCYGHAIRPRAFPVRSQADHDFRAADQAAQMASPNGQPVSLSSIGLARSLPS